MGFDVPTRMIADFCASSRFDDLSGTAKGAAVRHYLDAVGCAYGGMSALPCQVARDLARASPTPKGCSAFGISELVVPEQAVFVNSSAVRQLDFNDSYPSPARLHPSDMLPAVFAAAELMNASGRSVIFGTYMAYETAGALCDIYPIRDAGWDQSAFVAVGSAMGAGVILGLSFEQLANALSLALTPNMALRSTRGGELSHWKGCATAQAAMNGLFAARLAKLGMTGPEATFEGPSGLNQKVQPLKPLDIGNDKARLASVERSSFKLYPAENASQAMIAAFVTVREELRVDDIDRISIETWWGAWHEIGGGQGQRDHDAKWNPQNRETADHSLPYIAAVSLVDGTITAQSFEPERFLDPSLRPLMEKIVVAARDDLTALDRDRQPSDITIDLKTDRKIKLSLNGYPIGHYLNPMSDSQLSAKFQSLVGTKLASEQAAQLESTLWALEQLPHVSHLAHIFRQSGNLA
jgi:2-methylcitrate dehydratase